MRLGPALKKKGKVDIEDLFGDDVAVEEDLVHTPSHTEGASAAPSQPAVSVAGWSAESDPSGCANAP